MSHRDLILLLLAGFFLLGLARAQPPAGGHLLVGGSPAVALATEVEVEIVGMVATVEVRQRFRNDGREWTEAVYAYPLPPSAAVRSLRLEIDERVIEAEIRERGEARRQFRQAAREGRRAAEVSEGQPGLFRTRVANVPPGAEVASTLSFVQTVAYADGAFSFRFPLTRTPRFGEAAVLLPPGSAPVPALSLRVELDAGFPVAHVATPGHAARIEGEGRRRVVRLEAPGAPDRDFELIWEPVLGKAPTAALMRESHADADYLLLMLLPPAPAYRTAAPRELVLVLDKSGSMAGEPMAQARDSLRMAVASLAPEDRFNLIAFDDDAVALFDAPVDAGAGELAAALDWIDGLEAEGGTRMDAALELALSGAPGAGFVRQVVFITDGAVDNETALFARIARDLGPARLFTVGIGAAPNAWFMRKAAEFGRGSTVFVSDREQVGERMDTLLRRLEHPVLTEVHARWPEPAEVYPRVLPDLYAGEPLLLAARLPRGARGKTTVRGERPAGPWEASLELGQAHPGFAVATLWARHRIEDLMDGLVLGADPGEVRREVTRLGLHHRLVTPYTSLLAVERTPVRPAGAALRATPVPASGPRGTPLAGALVHLPQTDAGTVMRLSLGVLLLLLAWIFARRLGDAS